MPTSTPTQTPYCSNCGYDLSHVTESSRCPECGRPLVEVLMRRGQVFQGGRRYRSDREFLGLPLIHIAIGPKDGEMRGRARGFLAIGDEAMGVIAVGGIARGGVAFGGVALGGLSMGGASLGLIGALGGLAIGGAAAGGGAIGGLATGGGAAGFVAQGGGAVGYYARGGSAFGPHTISMGAGPPDPAAQSMFDSLSWFFGAWPPTSLGLMQPLAVLGITTLASAAFLLLIAFLLARPAPPGERPFGP